MCITGVGIFYLIMGEFSYWIEFYPVVLLKVDKSSEISFYYTILFFSLAIGLRIEDSEGTMHNS